MSKSVRQITLCAIFTAFSVVFVYISSIFPTGQLGFSAVASLFVIAAVVEYNVKGGLMVYIASSVLCFLLVPDKTSLLIYVLFFGYYPLVKLFAERLKSRAASYALKLIILNAALCLLVFLFSVTIFDLKYISNSYIILFLAVNIVFVIFDMGLTQVIGFYMQKISPKIRKNN